MKKNFSVFTKPVVQMFALLLAGVGLFLITSCNSDDGGDDKKPKGCLILKKNKLKSWVKEGWTKPGDANFITTLLLKVKEEETNFDVTVQALKGKNGSLEVIKGSKLEFDMSSEKCKMDGEFLIGRHYIDFDSLHLTNSAGELEDFDFIRLVPEMYLERESYLSFRLEVVKVDDSNKEKIILLKVSLPCPPCPYCKPPCRDSLRRATDTLREVIDTTDRR